MHTPDLLDAILTHLQPYGLQAAGPGQWVCNPPWRPGADGHHLRLTADPTYGGGFKWFEWVDSEGGNGVQLAKRLNLQAEKPRRLSKSERYDTRQRLQQAAEAKQADALAAVKVAESWAKAAGSWIANLPPADADPVVVAYLTRRGLSAAGARLAGMVGASSWSGSAPHDGADPRFLWNRALVIPIVDAAGAVVGYRGRYTGTETAYAKERGPKGMAADHPGGRVYACHRMRAAMRGDHAALDALTAYGVVVTEGGPDMVAAAAALHDAWGAAAPLLLGVFGGGSGTDGRNTYSVGSAAVFEHRIPDAAAVVCLTHADAAGLTYATAIASHVGGSGDRAARFYMPPADAWALHPDATGQRCDVADLCRHHGPAAVVALVESARNHRGDTYRRRAELVAEPLPTPAVVVTPAPAPAPAPVETTTPDRVHELVHELVQVPETNRPHAAETVAIVQSAGLTMLRAIVSRGAGLTPAEWRQAWSDTQAALHGLTMPQADAWWDRQAAGMTTTEAVEWATISAAEIDAEGRALAHRSGIPRITLTRFVWSTHRAAGRRGVLHAAR
jgi:hypothetical protein